MCRNHPYYYKRSNRKTKNSGNYLSAKNQQEGFVTACLLADRVHNDALRFLMISLGF